MSMTKFLSTDCINLLGYAKEDSDEVKQYKKKLDSQMETVLSQLILFEGCLRNEQSQIQRNLQEKDKLITLQKEIILKLANKNEQLRLGYIQNKNILKEIMNKRKHCELMCKCPCHVISCEPVYGNETERAMEAGKDYETDLIPNIAVEEEIRRINNDTILQECTISLNASMSRPRRIVESGSIKELAKHHRQRRASGGNTFTENSKTPVTRSNSLPDAKSLNNMDTRTKSSVEISSSNSSKYSVHETMPLLHSETVLSQIGNNNPNSVSQNEKRNHIHDLESVEAGFVNSAENSESIDETNERNWIDLDDIADEGPPQFYDIDDNVMNTELDVRSGKFKHVKSPPKQSPNKNPRRPKEYKKRHKLKSNPGPDVHEH